MTETNDPTNPRDPDPTPPPAGSTAEIPRAGYTREEWITVTLVQLPHGETVQSADPRSHGGDLTAAIIDAMERASAAGPGLAAIYNADDDTGIEFIRRPHRRTEVRTVRRDPTRDGYEYHDDTAPATVPSDDPYAMAAAVAAHPDIRGYRPPPAARRGVFHHLAEWAGIGPAMTLAEHGHALAAVARATGAAARRAGRDGDRLDAIADEALRATAEPNA